MTTGRLGPEGLQNLQLLHPTSFSCYTHTVTAEEGLGRNICCQLLVPHKFAQQFPFEEGLLCNHAHLNTHGSCCYSYTYLPALPNSSRTPGMPSTWQPTEATYLSCSTSVLSLETECLTVMGMVRIAWTLLTGWDEMTLQNSSQRTTHSWKGRWVGEEVHLYILGKLEVPYNPFTRTA